MRLSFSRQRKTTVGLDIGSSLVKAVEIDFSRSAPTLKRLGIVPLPPEAIVDGEVMDRLLVLDAIRECMTQAGIRGSDIVTAVSGRALIVKKVLMDRMDQDDAQEAIFWEAEQHVPFDIDDVSLDFQILDEDVGGNQMQVLLVAAKKELIHQHADLVRDADLAPRIIDLDAFALQNCYESNYEVEPGQVVGLLDVGSEVTNLNIVQDGTPQFTRDLSIGRTRFVEEMQREFHVGEEEATKILVSEEPTEGLSEENLQEVVARAADEMSGGLERAFAYIQGGNSGGRLDAIVLSGGGAQMPLLRKHLAARHDVPVDVLDPLRTISYEPELFAEQPVEELAPLLTVPVGLGLRRLE
jgi:type IV pilus assembly protein PilM